MKSKALLRISTLVAAVVLTALPSLAADFYLAASSFTKIFNGDTVTMWGYASCDSTFATCGTPSVPGPVLTVPALDTALNVTLKNNLTVDTSIVIPGLRAAMVPERKLVDPRRVSSFTVAVSAGGSKLYEFTNVHPGTYIYHSGTQPQVQVQMGLYGGVKQDAAANLAYTGVPYSSEVVLFYSEIDPALHAAVAGGTYGTPAYPSTFDYKPKYYLINGEPYTGQAALAAGTVNQPTLIRFLSAALKHHTPTLNGGYFKVVAEDANKYDFPKQQYSVNLSPLKTFDVVWVPTAVGEYGLYDRAFGLMNDTALGGGMFRKLGVTGTPALVADDDGPFLATEEVLLTVTDPGVLTGDTGTGTPTLVSTPAHGTATLNATGSFTYMSAPNYVGPDQFTYKLTAAGGVESNVAAVSITVANNPINDPPVAVADAATTAQNTQVTIQVLANDSDPDPGTTLTVTGVPSVTNGKATFNATSVTFAPANGFTGTGTLSYTVSDNLGGTAVGNVSVTVLPNQAPVAVKDSASTKTNTAITFFVTTNDYDPDGTIIASTVTITVGARNGTAVKNANGSITYTPKANYRGTDTFKYTVKDNLGATSNAAQVTVNVVR